MQKHTAFMPPIWFHSIAFLEKGVEWDLQRIYNGFGTDLKRRRSGSECRPEREECGSRENNNFRYSEILRIEMSYTEIGWGKV